MSATWVLSGAPRLWASTVAPSGATARVTLRTLRPHLRSLAAKTWPASSEVSHRRCWSTTSARTCDTSRVTYDDFQPVASVGAGNSESSTWTRTVRRPWAWTAAATVRAIRLRCTDFSDGSPLPTSTTCRGVAPVTTWVVNRCVGPNASSALTAVMILVLDAGIWTSFGVCDHSTCAGRRVGDHPGQVAAEGRGRRADRQPVRDQLVGGRQRRLGGARAGGRHEDGGDREDRGRGQPTQGGTGSGHGQILGVGRTRA